MLLSLLIVMLIPVGVFATDTTDKGITPYGQICPACDVGQISTSTQATTSVPFTKKCSHKVYGHDNWKTQYYVTTSRCTSGSCGYLFDSYSSSREFFVSCKGYSA